MTATAVSAADEIQHPHKGGRHPVGQPPQEGIISTTGMTTTITTFMTATTMMFTTRTMSVRINPATLVWDWIHVPVVEEVQPAIEKYNPL
jgi:hypothetical protein